MMPLTVEMKRLMWAIAILVVSVVMLSCFDAERRIQRERVYRDKMDRAVVNKITVALFLMDSMYRANPIVVPVKILDEYAEDSLLLRFRLPQIDTGIVRRHLIEKLVPIE